MTAKTTRIFDNASEAFDAMMAQERSALIELRTRAGRIIYGVVTPPDDASDTDEILKLWDIDDDEIVDRKMRCRFRRSE